MAYHPTGHNYHGNEYSTYADAPGTNISSLLGSALAPSQVGFHASNEDPAECYLRSHPLDDDPFLEDGYTVYDPVDEPPRQRRPQRSQSQYQQPVQRRGGRPPQTMQQAPTGYARPQQSRRSAVPRSVPTKAPAAPRKVAAKATPSSASVTTAESSKKSNGFFFVKPDDEDATAKYYLDMTCKASLNDFADAAAGNQIKRPVNASIFHNAFAHYDPTTDTYSKADMSKVVIMGIEIPHFTNQHIKPVHLTFTGLHENSINLNDGTSGRKIVARLSPECNHVSYGRPVYDGRGNIKNAEHLAKFGTVDAESMQMGVVICENRKNPELSTADVPIDHICISTFKKNEKFKQFVTEDKRKRVHNDAGEEVVTDSYQVPLSKFLQVTGAIRDQVMESFHFTDLTKMAAIFSIEASSLDPVTNLKQTRYKRASKEKAEKILDACNLVDCPAVLEVFVPRCLKEGDKPGLLYKDTPEGRAELEKSIKANA